MIINKIIYLLNESFKSIHRSLIPSLVSSFTIAISLIVLSLSYFIYINIQYYTYEIKDEYKIEVFFNNDLKLSESLDVFNNILLIDGIEEGSFIDKETAASIFKKEFDEDVINIIGSNPLPMGGSYGVSDEYRHYSQLDFIVKQIDRIPNVDEAMFPAQSVISFDKISRNVLGFSFMLGIFIMFIAVFFVSNTILLIVYSKKYEIKTLQLLGASKSFIKLPYIFEGIILGFVGGVVSLLILFWFNSIFTYLTNMYYYIPEFPFNHILILNFISGILLGLIGSSRALSSSIK